MKTVFLILLSLIGFASPAWALSCMEPSFERDLADASAVFEGRVTKIERRFDGGNGNAGSHLEKATVIVEKSYKGDLMPDQEVTVILHVWLPLANDATDWVESETETQKGLFALAHPDEETKALAGEGATAFSSGMCDTLVWEVSPENIQMVELAIAK